MIERVVENWLIKVNERSMEIPFCQLLTSEGYQVVHLSRHGPFEQGKDVIAIAPDGTPCAFQLKGSSGRITQSAWAQDYLGQVIRLVEVPIKHPSIDPGVLRRVYFVTNGELDEEVRLEIEDRNQDWARRGCPRLETIVRGQLLTRFLELHTNFWPMELSFEKKLLELFLADGTDNLNKQKLANFIYELLALSSDQLNRTECSRRLASTAVMTAYALSPYDQRMNHVAVFEGWVIYTAHLVALAEKYGLDNEYWKDSLDISISAVEQSLISLCEELRNRIHLVEGDPLVDQPFYRGRITWLVGLVSTFALWNLLRGKTLPIELADWVSGFVKSYQKDLLLWGEAAIPQFLANFWFLLGTESNLAPINLLASLIESISTINAPGPENTVGLPDPYHSLPEVMEMQLGLRNTSSRETYLGGSYTLEALIHLLAKRSWRQKLRHLWPQITRFLFTQFQPENTWEFCLWRLETGTLVEKQPKMPQSWEELRKESRVADLSRIPILFQSQPELLLAYIIVCPHRLTTDVAKFLDNKIQQARKT